MFFHSLVARLSSISIETLAVPVGNRNDAGQVHLGAIESALARPRNRWIYESVTDIATLAAAYGYGLTRGHGYVDGNKRVGFVAMAVFLDLNGWILEAPEPEVVQVMLAVASGDLSETDFIRWMQGHIQALEQTPG